MHYGQLENSECKNLIKNLKNLMLHLLHKGVYETL